jgi:hypothetical protein
MYTSRFAIPFASSESFGHDSEVTVHKHKRKVLLDPNAPGLDKDTRARRRVLAEMQRMTSKEIFDLAVRAGIYTKTGKLTKHYRSDGEPSKYRPTD